MEWYTPLFSVFGGGLAVAIINWVVDINRQRSARHVDYLKDQLRCLYGPLFYYLTHNDLIFEFIGKIDEAYKKEFVDSPRALAQVQSSDKEVRDRIESAVHKTIAISNAYVEMAIANGGKIEEIIVGNFSYVDPGDLEMARQFMHDRMRVKLEREPDDKTRFPDPIDRSLGTYTFHRPAFTKRIEEKFRIKSDELRKLQDRTPWHETLLSVPRSMWVKFKGP